MLPNGFPHFYSVRKFGPGKFKGAPTVDGQEDEGRHEARRGEEAEAGERLRNRVRFTLSDAELEEFDEARGEDP